MPEPAVAPPPAAQTPQPVKTPVPPQAPPKPAAAPESTPTPTPPPAPPAKPTAREHPMKRFKDGLRKAVEKGPDPEIAKEAGLETPKPTDPPTPPEPEKKTEPEPTTEPKTGEPEKTPEPDPTKPEGEPPAEPGDDKDKPLGPWQQKQKWEREARKYESENIQLREQLAQAGNVPELTQRAEAAEERVKAAEEKIRMLDFTHSEKYEKEVLGPYRDAFQGAVAEMTQLSVTLEDGQTRQITEGDVQYLLNLPKQQAREKAKEAFGEEDGRDFMDHWKAVRSAREAHDKKLETEKQTGAERYKQEHEQQQAIRQENFKSFQEFKASDESEQDFLKEKEGDDEWNSLLNDRRDYVDKSLAGTSSDPSLTPEQRRETVRRHATVRGRAIGYSMMKLENTRLKTQVEQLNAKLAEFKTGEPGSGEPPSPPALTASTNPFDRVRAAMRSKAKTRNF